MESVNQEQEDTSGSSIFNIAVILRQIFKHSNPTDLLKFSLVNKLWLYEARRAIKEHKQCHLLIDPSNPFKLSCPCRTLEKCFHKFSQLPNLPFTGITIHIESHQNCQCDEDHFSRAIDWNVRHLKIIWNQPDETDCGGAVIRSLFLNHSARIEEVYLICIFKLYEVLQESIHEVVSFPRLKVLRFSQDQQSSNVPSEILSAILSRSPNLKELHLKVSTSDLTNLRRDEFKTIVEYEFFPYIESDSNRIFALERPRLQKLTAWAPGVLNLHAGDAWETLEMLLESSQNSLRFLKTDSVVLKWMASPSNVLAKGQSFISVTKLAIGVHVGNFDDAGMWNVMPCIDIGNLFPKLTDVLVNELIRPRMDFSDELIGQGEQNKSVESVKALTIEYCFSSKSISVLHKIFPSVTTLNVFTSRGLLYDQVWSLWPNLESLKIKQIVDYAGFNLDSAFCGLHFEEIDWLRRESDEFLEKFHVVPIRPALVTMNQLGRLELTVVLRNLEHYSLNGLFFLSKVTTILLAQRMPGLSVKINCNHVHSGNQLGYLMDSSSFDGVQYDIS